MDCSGQGNNSRNHKSISPNSSSVKSFGIQPEVVEALNSKVMKLQQKMQQFVKICIPDLERPKVSSFSPKNIRNFNVSSEDFNKVTSKAIEKHKKVSSPILSPRTQEPRCKVALKLANNSPDSINSGSKLINSNTKPKSLYKIPDSFTKELDKSRLDQAKLQRLFSLNRNFLKNIIKLCNTCPEPSKIPLLVSENCLNFARDLEKIEKREKCVSFSEEKGQTDEQNFMRVKERYELKLIQKNEKIDELDLKNFELNQQISKSKEIFLEFSDDKSMKENDFLLHIVKRINRFSNNLKSVENKTKQLLNAVGSKLKGNRSNEGSRKNETLEGLLIDSKNRIYELEENIGKLHSYKTENFLLVSDLAKASELHETLKKNMRIKELELKKREKKLIEVENEKNELVNSLEKLQVELNENKDQITKLNIKYDQEINEFKHSNIILQHRIHKLEKEKNDLLNGEKILNKKISEYEKNEEKSESQTIEKIKSEKVALENSLEGFYKVLKEKIVLEEKLGKFEEILYEKNELRDRLSCLEGENNRLIKESDKFKNLDNKSRYQTEVNENYSKEIKEKNTEIEKINQELQNLLVENLNYKEKLVEIKFLVSENEKLKQEKIELEKFVIDSKALANNSKFYQQQFEEKNKEIQYLIELNQNLEQENLNLKNQTDSLKCEMNKLQDKKKQQESSNSILITEATELEADIKSLTDKLLNKSEEISNLEERIYSLSKAKGVVYSPQEEDLKKELFLVKSRLDDTSNELNESIIRITFLKDSVNQLETQNKRLNEKLKYYEKVLKVKKTETKNKSPFNLITLSESQDFKQFIPDQNLNSESSYVKRSILRNLTKDEFSLTNRVSFEPSSPDILADQSPEYKERQKYIHHSKSVENIKLVKK